MVELRVGIFLPNSLLCELCGMEVRGRHVADALGEGRFGQLCVRLHDRDLQWREGRS